MFDVQANSRIVRKLEAILIKARAGQIAALAIATIDATGAAGDAVVELQPEPILIPAIVGSLHMLANDLQAAQTTPQAATRRHS